MGLLNGNTIQETDFINEAGRNATPANDAGKAPKLEADGRLHDWFTHQGNDTLNAGATINGATLPVPVYQNKTDNELYACDGNDTNALKFIGFAISNSTDGNPIRVRFNGIVGGFSGLDEGEKYYLSDTVGTIQNSPGTYEVLVGIAISPTELLIQRGKRFASGTQGFSSTTTSVITLGFRPKKVTVWAVSNSGADQGSSFGSWSSPSSQKCVYQTVVGGSSNTGTNNSRNDFAWYAYRDGTGATNGNKGTITSVIDTGFTLSNTLEGTATTYLYWEAEGEL